MNYGKNHKASTTTERHPKNHHKDDSDLDPSDNVGAFVASVGLTQMDKLLVDSGASSHMT